MNTCSLRYARPRTMKEGLFCIQEPEARYELAACGNCGLCYPRYDMKYRSNKFIVHFLIAFKHGSTYLICGGPENPLMENCHPRKIVTLGKLSP